MQKNYILVLSNPHSLCSEAPGGLVESEGKEVMYKYIPATGQMLTKKIP